MARLQGEEVMYVFVRMRIGGVVVSGWLTHSYMVLFSRKDSEPIDVTALFSGREHDNPYSLSNKNRCTTFNMYDMARLIMRFEMLEETCTSKENQVELLQMKLWEYHEARKQSDDKDNEDDGDE